MNRIPCLLLLSLASALPSLAEPQSPSGSFGDFVRPTGANPILTARRFVPFDCPIEKKPVEWEYAATTQPAAVVRNGKVFLFYTGREWENHRANPDAIATARIGLAESADGITFTRSNTPVLFPAEDAQKEFEWEGGCESPRVVETKEGTYVMIYRQVRFETIEEKPDKKVKKRVERLASATSRDLIHWEKQGSVFGSETGISEAGSGVVIVKKEKDRLVASQIGGKYWMYWGNKVLHLASSDDLLHWTPLKDAGGKLVEVLKPEAGRFDSLSVAAGPCALATDAGIVVLYNARAAKSQVFAEGTWAVGEAFFDGAAPEKLVRRGERPVLKPELPYEAAGQSGAGITEGCGLAWFKGRWHLYYGADNWRTAVVIADPTGKPINPPVVRKPKQKVEPLSLKMEGYSLLASGWEMIEAPAVSGSAQELSSPQFDTSSWLNATVPGTVLGTLVDQGIEPDPLHGDNNLRISEKYCRQAYWYRNVFKLPENAKGRLLQLEFEGINYAAEVWLNGQNLGKITGAFALGKFDITAAAKPGELNVLLVNILPQPNPGIPHEQSLGGGAGSNGGIAMMDGPTFGCSMGWDWIPGIRDRCAGIWQNVGIRCTDAVKFGEVQVVTRVPSLDRAEVTLSLFLDNPTKQGKNGFLRGRVGDLSFEKKIYVSPGHYLFDFKPESTPVLSIANPRLWWPNGYGKPELYDLELSFVGEDGVVSDSRKMKIGLREMSYELSHDGGMETIIKVNGQRIFCRGGNWGMDEALKRLDPVRMDAWLRFHRDANLNMIRNWVAQSTSELFYQKCDEYGILVWNDFALANPGDGPAPANGDLFIQNMEQTVLRYRNHPSIALWCGRNEGVPPVELASKMYHTVWQWDKTRMFIPHSASYGVSGWGPYSLQSASTYFNMAGGIKSELGMPSVPTLAGMQAMLAPKDHWPISDAWAYHDFCSSGAMWAGTFVSTMETSFGAPRDLADFCRKATLLNYDRHRAAYEGWGQRMWRGASGLLLWMTHCSWPSTVWQLYSHDLEPTSSLFGAQKACEPVHVQMDPRNRKVSVVNLPPQPVAKANVSVVIFDPQGSELHRAEQNVDVAGSGVTDCLQLPEITSGVQLVSLILRNSQGSELSRNFYWVAKEDKQLQALNEMPKVNLEASAKVHKDKDKSRILVQLRNPSKHIAFMTQLTLRNRSGERVLPVFYGENYVSLLPGESREISIEQASESKGLKLEVEGWNIGKNTVKVKE